MDLTIHVDQICKVDPAAKVAVAISRPVMPVVMCFCYKLLGFHTVGAVLGSSSIQALELAS